MRNLLRAILLLSCTVTLADEPAAPPAAPAKIRIAGVLIKKFSVWHAELPNCAKPAGKPWLFLDCGFSTCPKFPVFDIPLDLNYPSWRLSPRVTQVKIDADKPFTMHLGGTYVHGAKDNCFFDASFTPRAGAMYEASVDPNGDTCALSLTEIRRKASGDAYERVAVDGAVIKRCLK